MTDCVITSYCYIKEIVLMKNNSILILYGCNAILKIMYGNCIFGFELEYSFPNIL